MRTTKMLLGAALLAATGLAAAEPARVEAVQYPAWLERGGNAVPLTPGTRLEPSDKLRTGANARVQLRMGEGSTVKLGENAQFVIEKMDDRSVFRAALSVITGAFRFTTDALRKSQRRDIAIKVKNVTAGIRGTDLWGKSTGERDLVCLLEGKISVGSEGHPTVTLDQPLDFYQKPREGEPAVARVDAKQVEIWSQETEISRDGPAARMGGQWSVIAGKFSTRDEALNANRVLRASGYPAVLGTSGEYPTVTVPGLAGEAEARALMANLRSVPGIVGPTVKGP
jgi:hypothetical protein